MAEEVAPESKKKEGNHVENALDAKPSKAILRHAKAPSISIIPTQN